MKFAVGMHGIVTSRCRCLPMRCWLPFGVTPTRSTAKKGRADTVYGAGSSQATHSNRLADQHRHPVRALRQSARENANIMNEHAAKSVPIPNTSNPIFVKGTGRLFPAVSPSE